MSFEANFNFVYNTLKYMTCSLINTVRSLCKTKKEEPHVFKRLTEDCLHDTELFKELYEREEITNYYPWLCLATQHGRVKIVEWLLDKKGGDKDVNRVLDIACQYNRHNVAEIAMKRGADVKVGLRKSKSNNITQMLYRYKQGYEKSRILQTS